MGVSDVDEGTEVRRLTVEEIALLREVSRWRRNHGVNFFQWRPGVGFGAFTEWYRYDGRKRRTVSYEPKTGAVLVDRDYYGGGALRELPVRTVTETIDCLVALGYLPPRFSSAYRAGWHAAQVWEAPAVHSDDPDEFARLFHDPENISFPVGED